MNRWETRHQNYRFRIGLLVPSSNTIMENDLHRALDKERFTVHAARMHLEETVSRKLPVGGTAWSLHRLQARG